MHDFVLNLYSKNADITSINTLRGLMAASTSFPKLPPTKDTLKHIALMTSEILLTLNVSFRIQYVFNSIITRLYTYLL
jgi:hypothetical protein